MVVSPVVRHSGRSAYIVPVKDRRYELLCIDSKVIDRELKPF